MLQNNVQKLVDYVRQNGNCIENGNGNSDVFDGIISASQQFIENDRNRKIIIINGCKDSDSNVFDFCQNEKISILDDNKIDAYIINLIHASNASNVILTKEDAKDYLYCVADDDINRVCSGKDAKGVTIQEFDNIIEYCLLPGICTPPTQSPTPWPTKWPTQWPS